MEAAISFKFVGASSSFETVIPQNTRISELNDTIRSLVYEIYGIYNFLIVEATEPLYERNTPINELNDTNFYSIYNKYSAFYIRNRIEPYEIIMNTIDIVEINRVENTESHNVSTDRVSTDRVSIDSVMCSICYEDQTDVFSTNCGHEFCRCCIRKWRNMHPENPTCPICRAGI